MNTKPLHKGHSIRVEAQGKLVVPESYEWVGWRAGEHLPVRFTQGVRVKANEFLMISSLDENDKVVWMCIWRRDYKHGKIAWTLHKVHGEQDKVAAARQHAQTLKEAKASQQLELRKAEKERQRHLAIAREAERQRRQKQIELELEAKRLKEQQMRKEKYEQMVGERKSKAAWDF